MFSFKSIVAIVAALAIGIECSEVAVPVAAPLTVPAHVGYSHAVPDNIPPYASQISVVNRALAAPAPFAAPVAAPFAAAFPGPFGSAPLAAPFGRVAVPYAAGPFVAGPYAAGPYFPGPVAAPYAFPGQAAYASPYPYASSSLLRTPFGLTPTFVR